MTKITLDSRLSSMADLVRQGAVFADIGTDHGFLPVFLLLSGRIERAILTDVNEGPLSSAALTVKQYGLTERVKLILTDGLSRLDGEGATDIAICGMGGDLIARIISESEFIRRTGVRLILQPMTRQATLRKALAAIGFEIVRERYSFSAGKYYLGLAAEFCGEQRDIGETEAELGSMGFLPEDREAYLGYMRGKARSYDKAIEGRRLAGEDITELSRLRGAAEALIKTAEK